MATPEDPGQQPVAPITTMVEHVAIPSTAGGLTKREWFAGMAMMGLLSCDAQLGYEEAANHAVRHADALLAELAKAAQP